jgi:predicted dehydrogenase
LESFASRWSLPSRSLYTDYRKLLESEQPDIVSIASWTETHCPITLAAAAAKSVRAIYCEKPIATNLREAGRMVSACKNNGVTIIIGHERRFDSNFVKVKEMVDKKRFGPLKTIVGHALSRKPPRLPTSKYVGGALYHDGTHLMDLILYYGGPAKWVVAFDERPNGRRYVESTATGLIRLRNGVNVFVEGGGERDYFKFDLDLQFQNGRIKIGNSGISVFSSEESKNFTGFNELSPASFETSKSRYLNPFIGAVDELVRTMESGEEPASNGIEARNALELILSMYKSASRGGRKVYIHARNGN